MGKPPGAPQSPAQTSPPSHSRHNSHGGESQFSEHNPLQDGDQKVRYPAEPKKPKAVALHGWQRTVGVDEDFDPTIPVCLGAPGTGLFTAKTGQNKPAAGVGVGVGAVAVVDLGKAKVTREDKKEAKSLRLQPAAPDAAPLPYPRVAAVDTASESSSSSSSSSSETDDSDPTGHKKERKDQLSQFETNSEASSDMSFLVNATSGSFLGNRQTFGRKIDPRTPATVGEERLYNSLAQYFGNSRRNVAAGGGGGGGGGGSSGSAGDKGDSSLPSTGGGAGGKNLLLRRESGAGSSKAAGTTPGSTANTTALSASGGSGSGSGSTMNTNNSQTASMLADHHHPNKNNGSRSMSMRSRSSGETVGGRENEEGESKRKEEKDGSVGSKSRSRTSGAEAVTEAMAEEGRLAKKVDGEAVPVEPGRRLPKCSFLRRWPWKILSGVVTLAAVVAVVLVVVVSTEGGPSSDTRRRLLAPQLLSPDGTAGWSGGFGGGSVGYGEILGGVVVDAGAVQAGLGHSRRILSVHGVMEPVVVAGGGGDAAAAAAAAAGAAEGEPPARQERWRQRR
eukprot:g12604.t1